MTIRKRIDKIHGFYIEDLSVGMTDIYRKIVKNKDVTLFADISGDTNPLHLDKNFARSTIFKDKIIHGFLTASFISATIGTKLPGPGSIYVSQTLKFLAPVRVGDKPKTQVTVTKINLEKNLVSLKCVCSVGAKEVLTGDAVIWVPSRVGLSKKQKRKK